MTSDHIVDLEMTFDHMKSLEMTLDRTDYPGMIVDCIGRYSVVSFGGQLSNFKAFPSLVHC